MSVKYFYYCIDSRKCQILMLGCTIVGKTALIYSVATIYLGLCPRITKLFHIHITDGCQGPNDVQVNGVCYYVEEQLLSNTEAIANCHDAFGKGKLFEPRDKETHDSVVAAALEISSQMYWLGISDALSEGHFQYLSGGNITFSNWRAGSHKKHVH